MSCHGYAYVPICTVCAKLVYRYTRCVLQVYSRGSDTIQYTYICWMGYMNPYCTLAIRTVCVGMGVIIKTLMIICEFMLHMTSLIIYYLRAGPYKATHYMLFNFRAVWLRLYICNMCLFNIYIICAYSIHMICAGSIYIIRACSIHIVKRAVVRK
jgi:hypothetical protein